MHKIPVVTIRLKKVRSFPYPERHLNNAATAADMLSRYLKGVDREYFVVVPLGVKNEVNAITTVSVGTLNSALVHPREIFKEAILHNACSIILCHNHPSGDPTPSQEDWKLTWDLRACGDLLGIAVQDHIVIGDNGRFTSMLESGSWNARRNTFQVAEGLL